jgi:hypothetical protein
MSNFLIAYGLQLPGNKIKKLLHITVNSHQIEGTTHRMVEESLLAIHWIKD